MADNDQLLEKFGKLIDKKLDEKLEPIKTELGHHTTMLGQQKTMVEAVLAGQEELQKTAAREATVVTGFSKLTNRVNNLSERVEELEKEAGIPHPHKH